MYLQSKSNVSVTALKRKFESVPFLPSSSASSRHEGIGVTHSHHVSRKDFKQVAVEKALPKSLYKKRKTVDKTHVAEVFPGIILSVV